MRLKIIHTPRNEANNAYSLSKAERELGIFSRVEVLKSDNYFDTADRNWSNGSYLLTELMRWPLMIYALLRFNVIHYNYGSLLTPSEIPERGRKQLLKKIYNRVYARPLQGIDVKLASFFNKKILITYQGDDARIVEYCKDNYKWHFSKEEDALVTEDDDDLKIKRINIFNKYAHRIYAVNPDLLNTLPSRASFIPYSSVFPENIEYQYPDPGNEPITIVHAPTDRSVKGTRYLLSAAKKLKEEGFNFKLILVEGYSNEDALKIYKQADLVVDQLLAGWYGAFAVEAMAMGKPVMCYIRESDLKHIPEQMAQDLPIINVNPDTIYQGLKSILSDEGMDFQTLGRRARDFAIRWHSPEEVANRILKDIENVVGSNQD